MHRALHANLRSFTTRPANPLVPAISNMSLHDP